VQALILARSAAPGAPDGERQPIGRRGATAGPPDITTVLQIAARNGIELLGPVPAGRA
jgi:hypothetical protein